MGATILDSGCQIQCPHGGMAAITPGNSKVQVGGNFALLSTDQMIISGCSFTLPSGPMPCVTVQWSAPATKVTVNGAAVLLSTSVGLCMNALNAPQGPASVSGAQTKVEGQ